MAEIPGVADLDSDAPDLVALVRDELAWAQQARAYNSANDALAGLEDAPALRRAMSA